jgi:hypothetical protein
MMRSSEDSDDEIEYVESTNGADPGKVMTMHITTPLSPFLSLLDSARMQTHYCPVACCEMRMQAPSFTVNLSQIHHLRICNSDPRVLVQGAEADETVPPSAETFSQSAKTDKIVQLSDKPGPPSPKAPRTRRASSQPAQRRTPKPLDFVSISASQPRVFKHMVGVHLCAVPD